MLRQCRLEVSSLHVKHDKEKAAKEAHNTYQSPLEISIGAQNCWCWSRRRTSHAQWSHPGCVKLGPRDSLGLKSLSAQFPDPDMVWSFSNPQGIFLLDTYLSLLWIHLNIWQPQCAFGKNVPVYYHLQREAPVDSFQLHSSNTQLLATSLVWKETSRFLFTLFHTLFKSSQESWPTHPFSEHADQQWIPLKIFSDTERERHTWEYPPWPYEAWIFCCMLPCTPHIPQPVSQVSQMKYKWPYTACQFLLGR